MNIRITFCVLAFIPFFFTSWNASDSAELENNKPVYELLLQLGDKALLHAGQFSAEQVQMGAELVKIGRTTYMGRQTDYVSKYYVCTTCHNLEREDPDLRYSNPETRLSYVKEKGMPFLQGTTFRGIVNRETWYNNDYVKKYGDEKIERAHEDLKESIQLCAIECSQGRSMEDWEIEAVLAYYWTLQWRLEDLDFTPEQLNKINSGLDDPKQYEALIKLIRSKYLTYSPAHFYDAPPSKEIGYEGLIGNPARGKDLYELSCLHCHKPEGVSHYVLDDSKLSLNHLKDKIPKDSHFSLYQIIAYGTYAISGHRPYMPHYPEERMSKQQVEDLRAYIEQETQ